MIGCEIKELQLNILNLNIYLTCSKYLFSYNQLNSSRSGTRDSMMDMN